MKTSTLSLPLCVILTFLCLISGVARADLTDGLMAYYPLDGNAKDASGNGYNGTQNGGVSYTSGVFEQAASFDGNDDYIKVLNSEALSFANGLTVSYQIKLETPAQYYFPYHIMEKWGSWHTRQRNWDLDFGINIEGGGYTDIWIENFQPNTFYNMTMTCNGSSFKIYRDGELVGNQNVNGKIASSNTNVMIGQYDKGGNYYFDGLLDDVRIYNRALSAAEVKLLAAPAPQEPQRPDPVVPDPKDSRYEFVIGGRAGFEWRPLELGMEFDLAVPGLDPISLNKTANYPENPIAKNVGFEYGFGTNNWLLGEILSAAAPIDINLVSAEGTAGIQGSAALMAETYLVDGQSQADFSIEAGLGIQAYAEMQIGGALISALEKLPVVGKYAKNEYEFEIPIVGTPTLDASASGFLLPFTFDYYEFRADVAAILGVTSESLDDEGTEQHSVNGVPITFVPDELKAGFQVGASASVYAETSLTGSVDIYFHEAGDTTGAYTIGDAFSDILDESVGLSQASSATSDTGQVQFSPEGGVQMTTGSPVWLKTAIESEGIVNLMAFDAEFLSEEGAEGLVSVYWGGQLVATIDERLAEDGIMSYLFALDETYQPGTHVLGLRVDSYTDVNTILNVENITLGYSANIPEPATLSLLALGGLAVLHKHRKR